MRRKAVCLLLVGMLCWLSGGTAQDQKDNPAELQGTIAATYKQLEGTLLKIANKLERTGTKEGVDKARVIYKALQDAREKEIGINLVTLADALREPDLAKLKTSIEKGTVVKGDLEALLAALLTERNSREHVEFLKNMIKQLEEAIRKQKVAISKNQSQAVEKEDAKRAQEAAQKEVEKILKEIKEYEAKTGGKPEEPKAGEPKAGEGKKGEKKDGQAKPGEKKDGKGEGKPGEGKEGQKKEGEKKEGESKGGEGKPGEGKPGEGEPKEGQGGNSKPGEKKEGEQQEGGIPKKRIQDAKDAQSKATEKIDKNERQDATTDQEDAKTKLEQARKRLEEILRQMREEEIERVLADLQKRCEKMLQMQEIVNANSKRINQRIYALGKAEREDEINANRLSEDEDKIITEADYAIGIIEAEGTAVAFTEVFHQVRNDMMQVSRRLRRVDLGPETLAIEEDIVTTLKEMIEALKKQQQEQRDRKQSQQQQNGNPSPQDLIDKLAELRMIKAMQLRVNSRTEQWGKRYQGEEAKDPAIVGELMELGKRQLRIWNVTDNIAKGRNK